MTSNLQVVTVLGQALGKPLKLKWKDKGECEVEIQSSHNNEVVQISYLLSAEGTGCQHRCFARECTEAYKQTSTDFQSTALTGFELSAF